MEIIENSNSTRCGILVFNYKEGLLNKSGTLTVLLSNESGESLCHLDNIDLQAAVQFGIRIHSALLLPGNYNLTVSNNNSKKTLQFTVDDTTLLRKQVRDELNKHGTPLVFIGPTDSKHYPYPELEPWFNRDDAASYLEKSLSTGRISEHEHEMYAGFIKNGFMIIENAFEEDIVGKVNSEVDDVIKTSYRGYEYGSSNRIEHLHFKYPAIRDLWLNTSCKKHIDFIFQNPARPSQTLLFIFGSQQDPHQDTIHLTPFPAGYMCGLWISLQDIQENSGELVVYPGSHKEKRLTMADLECEKVEGDWSNFGNKVVPYWAEMTKRYEPFVYRPKKGTALIWHENLLHGGSPRLDKSIERRSLVIHYFANDCVAYYDSTGEVGMAANLSEFQ